MSYHKSLHAHSSDLCDFVDDDPCVCHFCTCLIKEEILESAASGMPNEASGGSEHSQTVAHAKSRSTHDGMIAEHQSFDDVSQ